MSPLPTTLTNVPYEVKSVLLAYYVVMSRIESLSKADRDDLLALTTIWHQSDDEEERESARVGIEEILAQRPLNAIPLTESREGQIGLQRWSKSVGKQILRQRKAASMTQEMLAKATGLPQSHISRLEKGEHSPTHLTLSKIASAFNIAVEKLTPALQ
jgi:DNA-binding XRE family transcriptional regulator